MSFPDAKTVALSTATDFAHVPVADICAANGEEFLAAAVGDKIVNPGKRGVYTPSGVVGPVVVWADDPGRVGEAYDWLSISWGVPLDLGGGVEWNPWNGIGLPVSPWRVHVRERFSLSLNGEYHRVADALESAGLCLFSPEGWGDDEYVILPAGEEL
jgi:hypothetical protein